MEETIRQLLNQYVQGPMTLKDRLALSKLIKDPANKDVLLSFIDEQYSRVKNAGELPGVLTQSAFDEVFEKVMLHTEEEKQGLRISISRRWWAAASILLVTGIGIYFYIANSGKQEPAVTAKQHTDIQPGTEGALLTLDDGSTVLLDTIRNGEIVLQEGVTARVVNGALQYSGKGNGKLYNTTSTPRGRQFHITLPDGTGVWLNAASSIRYPIVFTEKERRVEVSGEAYFEVKKNQQQPFRVTVKNRIEVEVLGTEFNINAYDNEKDLAATLLNGSIRILKPSARVPDAKSALVLKPGQQLRVQAGADWKLIPAADIEKVMAWRKGLFNFSDVSFEEAMRQLQRWYDIEVVYQNGVPDIELMGEMTKGVSLNGLLIGLGKLGVHYKLEGRKLIILP